MSVAIYDENLDSVCIEKILKENELVISDRDNEDSWDLVCLLALLDCEAKGYQDILGAALVAWNANPLVNLLFVVLDPCVHHQDSSEQQEDPRQVVFNSSFFLASLDSDATGFVHFCVGLDHLQGP